MNIYHSLEFKKEPFSTSPDPFFFYHSLGHRSAKNRLEINVRLKRGLSVLLGDVGTGKTTLWRSLLNSFRQEPSYIFHIILDPDFTDRLSFLTHLAKLFGLDTDVTSVQEIKNSIASYLYQKTVEEDQTVVLIIDEGQKLTIEQLELLRVFLNYETNDRKMIQLVILGQLELWPKIASMPNFIDRISEKLFLDPLNVAETRGLIRFRLQQAGCISESELFTTGAIEKVHAYTKGYPRQIARMCHNAMKMILFENQDRVTQDVIDKVIYDDQRTGSYDHLRNFG